MEWLELTTRGLRTGPFIPCEKVGCDRHICNIVATNVDKRVAMEEKLPAAQGGGDLSGKELPELPAAVKNRDSSYTVSKLRALSHRFRRQNRHIWQAFCHDEGDLGMVAVTQTCVSAPALTCLPSPA